MIRQVTRYIPHKDENGKSIPITNACFVKLNTMYLSKTGTITACKKSAAVFKSKNSAKNFVRQHAKHFKVVPLTSEDFAELYTHQEEAANVNEKQEE